MSRFSSPMDIDFRHISLSSAALHLLLLLAAVALSGFLWLGAAQTSRAHAPAAAWASLEGARHINLPQVVVVARRQDMDRPQGIAMASLGTTDCANVPAARPAGGGPIRVTLQE